MKKALPNLKLNEANAVKLEQLDQLATGYMALVQRYVDHIFGMELKEARKFDDIPAIETALSARWQRCAWQQAVGMMRSFYSNERTNKPVLSNLTLQGNANVILLEPSNTETFDYWLRISTLEKGNPLRIPITLYPKARHTLSEGKLCSGVTLNKQDGVWYATLVVDLPQTKPQPDGTLMGVDLGIVNVITTSQGQQFGQFSEILKRRVEKSTQKKRRKMKLNACLKKKGRPPVSLVDKKFSRFIKNELGRTFNQFIKILPSSVTVVLENLSVKTMRFKSRLMNRILSASQLGYATQRLREKLDSAHIRYSSVVAAYSSQECFHCGFVDADNRPNQATFRCTYCGHHDHADANASKVLTKRFGDTELSGLADYREVKTILLHRFYGQNADARSVSGGLEPLVKHKSRDNRKVTVNQPTLTSFCSLRHLRTKGVTIQ